jgi:peptidoglycan hydrolase-like protein with peptidoglycan-binding domain/uncharacterized protein YegP (UPF0339 family)
MTRPVRAWPECRARGRIGGSVPRLPQLTVAVILVCALWPSLGAARGDAGPRLSGHTIATSLHLGRRAGRGAMLQLGSGERSPHGSAAVRRLQRGLRRAGYAPGPVDGRYGPLTAAAVERFQANHALQVDGIVGPATRHALRTVPPLRLGAGQFSAHGSPAVARLQRLLRHAGFSPGPIDGRLGPRTEQAIVAFQRARHLTVDGFVGPMTGRALRVGQRVPGRPARPRGQRRDRPSRSAPVTRAPGRSLNRRPAGLTAPAAPGLPMFWILIGLTAIGLIPVVGSYYQRPIAARVRRLTRGVNEMRKRSAATSLPGPAPVKFVLYGDNGRGYYWTIVAANGDILARSGSFASYEEANDAAYAVHRGAAAASFEIRSDGSPGAGLPAPGGAVTARDRPQVNPAGNRPQVNPAGNRPQVTPARDRLQVNPAPDRPQVNPGRGESARPRWARGMSWPAVSRPWPSGFSITPRGRRR